jgi:NADPH-dependent FMN reductase
MSKKLIWVISGSTSANSRTSKVVDYVLQGLGDTLLTRRIQLRDMDPEALYVSVARTVTATEPGGWLIIATPIFKASYSGLLKVFLDLLPQFVLAGKAILPIATGGSVHHPARSRVPLPMRRRGNHRRQTSRASEAASNCMTALRRSITHEIEPERADLRVTVVPDAMWPARAVGDEVAGVEHVRRLLDRNGELALENKAIFEAVVRDRLIGVPGARSVLVDRNRKSARFVLAQHAATALGREHGTRYSSGIGAAQPCD